MHPHRGSHRWHAQGWVDRRTWQDRPYLHIRPGAFLLGHPTQLGRPTQWADRYGPKQIEAPLPLKLLQPAASQVPLPCSWHHHKFVADPMFVAPPAWVVPATTLQPGGPPAWVVPATSLGRAPWYACIVA